MPVESNRAAHEVALGRHTNTLESQNGGARKYSAAARGFVANAYDAFHVLSPFH